MHKYKELAEKALVVFALFIAEGALIPVLIDSGDGSTTQTDSLTPALFMGIYMVTLLLIAQRWRSFVRVASKNIFIWLLVGMALASVYWTFGPDITPRRSVAFLLSTVFATYLATRYSLKEQLQLLAWAFGITIVLSIVFAVALPSYGLMTMQEGGKHAGAWRGVLPHKNILGRLMALSSMLFLLLASNSRKHRWVLWTGFFLCVALILLSTSKGALVVFVTLLSVFPLYRTWRWSYGWAVPLMIAAILIGGVAGLFILENAEGLATAMGKDLTFSGRTDIWEVSLELIGKRPWLGYGYSGFWLGWESEASTYVWKVLEWECPNAHNGFVDLGLELGVTGFILFLCSFLIGCERAITLLRKTRTGEGLWPLIYITFLVMCNITEGGLTTSNCIFWMLYVSAILSAPMELERARKSSYTMVPIDEEEWVEVEASNGHYF